MMAESRPPTDLADLAGILQQQINERTWGRIRQLHVEASSDRVVIQGATSSYYLKQLALLAVQEAMGSAARVPVALEIEVSTRFLRAPEGMDNG
jgi:hypothetical protein